MSGNPPSSRDWNRVSRQSPCPICSKPDWCTVSTGGLVACCMRVESQQRLRNGGWLHRLTDILFRPPPSIQRIHPVKALAPLDQRDRVYQVFVRELGLRPRHRDHLRYSRGLPVPAFESFASTPPRDLARRRRIAARIIDRLGNRDVLRGVPGFHCDQDAHWMCRAAPPGILVPVPDPAGRIQAFQVRFDRCHPSGPRYIWYSSRGKPGGVSPGIPVASWRPELTSSSQVLVTEGSLKAAVASSHLRTHVIGVPGVSNWRRVLNLLPRKIPVAIAYDADACTNPLVARHQLDLARALYWAGHPVAIAAWDPAWKGIDDAILAGISIDLEDWPGGSHPVPLHDASTLADADSLVETR